MKVVHISTDDYSGGAAIAAFRLHTAMRGTGIDSAMLVARRVKDRDGHVYLFPVSFFQKIKKKIRRKLRPHRIDYNESRGLFSYPAAGLDVTRHSTVREADAIYLHWINRDFVSIPVLEAILEMNKPVYWVLHDMWAMTGGCHHSFDCNKYTRGCSLCPHLSKPSKHDFSDRLFEAKLRVIDRFDNLHIITPSTWLGKCAKQSRLFSKKTVQVIPNILDTLMYKPVDKNAARILFNLPQHKKVILFGAIEAHLNPYKGWPYLLQALNELAKTDANCVAFIFGTGFNQELANAIPIPVYFSGHLHDDQSVCMVYNAADVFVAPSLADNFPNTVAESLACGTPVVGFDVGGIPDLIDHKKNGYLAAYKDSEDLANGILWVLSTGENLAAQARQGMEQMMNGVSESLKTLLNTK